MKVRIYGTPDCTYCTQAKEFCKNKNIPYEYITLSNKQQFEQLQEMVGKPVRTVPQIFMNEDGFDEYVGGYNELRTKIKNMTL